MMLPDLADALFLSSVQSSSQLTRGQLAHAIRASLDTFGGPWGCAAAVASEFGDHPESAATRMRWALDTVAALLVPVSSA